MLQKETIKQLLLASKPRLEEWGVCELGLFGSAKRNEMTVDSDIDILVDFDADHETYLNFMEACAFLESVFADNKIDVVSKKGLSPFIGPYILEEVEYV